MSEWNTYDAVALVEVEWGDTKALLGVVELNCHAHSQNDCVDIPLTNWCN